MAVKARDDVTLANITDVANVRRYYLLQSSTLAAPAAPTVNPAPSPWVTTEPSYSEGSTNTLYTVDLTVFSDATFDYSPVSKASSFEAAKSAFNKAVSATTTANAALAAVPPLVQQATPSATVVGQLWYPLDSSGRIIGMKRASVLGTGGWQDYLMMAGQILVPGTVGTTEIGPDGVLAANIKTSNELWAKIATFASVTTDMLLAGGATITGELLADVIQLATRLVAGDPAGDRTELNGAGIHIFKGGVERVRLAASAPNGLQVWNPSMAAMVDLSAASFGSQIMTHNPKLNIPVPGSQSAWGEWKPGAWVFQALGQWTATTNRAQIFSTTSLGDAGVAQSFGVQIAFTMQPVGGGTEIALTDTGGEYGAVVQRSSPNPNFGIVSCTPGTTYNVQLQARAIRYVSSPGGTPWIKKSQISLTPI